MCIYTDRQTGRQADALEIIYHAAWRVVNKTTTVVVSAVTQPSRSTVGDFAAFVAFVVAAALCILTAWC